MRKSTKLLGAIAIAGLVAAGGSAFTQSNTVPTSVAGYASAAITGVTVTNTAYAVNGTNASLLDSITFTEDEDISGAGHQAILVINGPTGTQITCSRAFVASVGTITCTTTGQAIAAVTAITLTVTGV